MTSYIKRKIKHGLQLLVSCLFLDSEETVNHISEYREQAQNEKRSWHDWVGNRIHLELCKRLKFNLLKRVTSQKFTLTVCWKKITCHLVDFAVAADHKIKMDTINKSLDLSRELKKLQCMTVTVILIVIGALGTVPNSLKKDPWRIGNQSEKRDLTTFLRSARILRKVLETDPQVKASVKNSQGLK